MRASIRSSINARLPAAAALWLCGAGAAWAGDGADLGSLQALLSGTGGLCQIFKMTSCPTVPTITQGVLEVAALGNNLPEMVRAQNSIPQGGSVNAGNPAAVPPPSPGSLTPLPLNTTTTPTVSEFLATLTPLGFISQSSGTAIATQLYDPKADTFLYAVGVTSFDVIGPGNLTDPDTAYFFYDDLSRTNKNFTNGQIIGKFSFPLAVLNNGAETAVMTTLQVKNVCTGGTCSPQAQAVGGIGTPQNPVAASQLGISFALVWSTSPAAPNSTHAIFEWGIPLLVTGACQLNQQNQQIGFCLQGQTAPGPNTDPAYFYSLLNPGQENKVNMGVYTAFTFDDLGSPLPQSMSIGLAPSAGPLGLPPTTGASASFALCANLPGGNGNGQAPVPSVGAYYAIATSGEMFLSAPLPSVSNSMCPPL
jgi:hypothetical protein